MSDFKKKVKTQSLEKRRTFIKTTSLISLSSLLGTNVVFGKHFPKEMIPIAFIDDSFLDEIPGKSTELIILNDKPINAETPAHLLDDDLTPNELFFVRNNGIPPEQPDKDNWTIVFEGESISSSKTYTLTDLKSKFKTYTYKITLECGGNGRSEFNPPAKGNQWNLGAVGCAAWTGIRLKDVLNDIGIKKDAKYIGYYGADTHISGDRSKTVISRGVPITKAMKDDNLIAWQMNGEDIPIMNGYPVRLIFGGWPASCSGKWLNKIVVRNKVHDGPKMTGQSYRVPCNPVAPGTKVPDNEMCIIEAMPVKSIITNPKTGAIIKSGSNLKFRGHSWAGDKTISKVEYSIDFGAQWHSCILTKSENLNHWQRFAGDVTFSKVGYYELWARATDEDGIAQPTILPGWNPRGYLNNACHRIAIKVE